MPPKKAPAKAASAKSAATTKKAAAAAKATAGKTASKTTSTAASKSAKPTTATLAKRPRKESDTESVGSASSKRKVDEPSPESDIENEAPKPKKAKTSKQPNGTDTAKPAAKAPTKPAKKAATKPAAKKATTPAPVEKTAKAKKAAAEPASKKRKAESPAAEEEEDDDDETAEVPQTKKAATTKQAKPKAATGRKVAIGKKINEAPTQKLDIYVFGEGTAGELGLGSRRVNGKKPIDVKRPRLNDNLSADSVGVVQIACGGMHAVALTHDNKLLTWGVNDQGALGRDTDWNGGLRDADADSDSEDDEDDTGLNPKESTPAEVEMEHFAPGTKFVQVVASDSATFALTEDGRVYGWGTFRGSEGILGFSDKVKVQQRPVLIPGLKDVTSIATGSNHVLALDKKGNVVAWGCGQQSQLGRRIIERNKMAALVPQGLGLPRNSNIVKIACGPYHSFALDSEGQVWAWGLNNFAETGIEEGAGKDDAVIFRPAKVTSLAKYKIADIAGGVHHSIACTEAGELLSWGRVDSHQVGIPLDQLNEENAVYDEQKKPRILVKPTVLSGVSNTCYVAAGTDNNFAVTEDGHVYSWGFSANFQTGLGTTEDVEVPTRIENTAIRDKKIIFADCGGQFSVLAGLPDAE